MLKDIGLGVVGAGLGAHLLAVNQDPSSRLKVRGVYDPDPQRRGLYFAGKDMATLAQQHEVEYVAREYEELLARKDIACIAVFSPCPCHAEQIIAALDAGKHAIVTKPMAVSVAEARAIVAAADRAGRKVLVAQLMRWNRMFQKIHALFEEGTLGTLHMAEACYLHDMRGVFDVSPWRHQMPQDFMYGGVCHPVDLLRWFLGEVDEVFAYGSRAGLDPRYPADKLENFIISLKFRNGVIARILGAFDLVHPPSLWNIPFHGVGIGLYGTKASLLNNRLIRDGRESGVWKEETILPEYVFDNHAGETPSMLHHLEDCIVNDRKPLVDARGGAQIVAVCSACWDSIRSGKPVKVTREFDRVTTAVSDTEREDMG
ncbi:MAG: Gfo/Idh/MocA family oxidoreductase [Kiritimatiellae bacterium]|nr:Gfo/Idh/MocA family oxidoreductase [Kiritimatiellia bacterium]